MEDPSSLLVDSDSPWQIPYSPLISEEPLYSHILTESSRVSKNHGIRSNGLDLEALFSTTNAGIPVEKSYQQVDLADQLEAPGEFPFGRGITEDGYRSSLWVMGQYSGCTSPQETNARIRSLLDSGQAGFSIALDLPTQNGLDADHPLAEGEVGKVGVPISSLDDMVEILDKIDLTAVSQIRTTANSIGPIAVALFVAAARVHGYKPEDFRVMLQNDSLKEYLARGTQIFPPRHGLEFSIDVVEYCARHLPHWEPIEFCGYHIRDAGSNATQEVAIAIANAFEYISASIDRGLNIDDFAHRLFMFLSADIEIFEEAAKFRATRRIWARAMRDRFGAELPESMALNFFAYTLGGSLAAAEPLNNVARIAFEALGAVLGGVQTLATSSYDEAIRIPTSAAARLSLRSQQIIAFETGVAKTADPLGGSYYVEALTQEMEARIEAYISLIEQQGGALVALESGWLHSEIENEAFRQQARLESGEKPRVGVNLFGGADDQSIEVSESPASREAEQVEKLRRLRAERDSAKALEALKALRKHAQDGGNTVEPILEAVTQGVTVGEVVETLKAEWGSYR